MGCLQTKINDKPTRAPPNKSINTSTTNTATGNVRSVDYKLIQNMYSISPKILGIGNFGKVFLAHSNVNPDFKVAIKTM